LAIVGPSVWRGLNDQEEGAELQSGARRTTARAGHPCSRPARRLPGRFGARHPQRTLRVALKWRRKGLKILNPRPSNCARGRRLLGGPSRGRHSLRQAMDLRKDARGASALRGARHEGATRQALPVTRNASRAGAVRHLRTSSRGAHCLRQLGSKDARCPPGAHPGSCIFDLDCS